MKDNRYSLHEIIFSGDTEEDRMLREDARVQKILEDVRYQLEGELIMEGWFSDMFAKVKGWFSDLFGFGGDDDDASDDPDQFKPTEKDLKGALSAAGAYGELASLYTKAKGGGYDEANKAAASAWPQIKQAIGEKHSAGGGVTMALVSEFKNLSEIDAFVTLVVNASEAAVDAAFKMNQGFGTRIVKAVENVPMENFLPKEDPKKETKEEGRTYSLTNALFEQDDATKKEDPKAETTPKAKEDPKKKAEPKKPSQEAMEAAKKKRDMMLQKTKETAKDVFGNRAMAEFQCEALAPALAKSISRPILKKMRTVRSTKKDHWSRSDSTREGVSAALDRTVSDLMDEKGINTDEKTEKIGLMIYDAFQTKDPVKYYFGLLTAFKQSE